MSSVDNISQALQVLVVLLACVAFFARETDFKVITFRSLLAAATTLVVVVLGQTLIKRESQDRSGSTMDLAQVEFCMRLYSAIKSLSGTFDDMPGSAEVTGKFSEEADRIKEQARKAMSLAADKDSKSFMLCLKKAVLLGEVGGKGSVAEVKELVNRIKLAKVEKPELAILGSELIDKLYLKRSLNKSEVETYAQFVEGKVPAGWFRDVTRVELYRVAGMKAEADKALNRYNQAASSFVQKILFTFFAALVCGLVGLVVLIVQLFLIPRNISQGPALEEIKAPINYGFEKVFAVFIFWLALECMISPVIVNVARPLKGLGMNSNTIALITMVIYLMNNVPSLLLVWLLCLRGTGIKFVDAVKLKFKTPRRGWFGLVLAGVLTWCACLPLVLVGSALAKGYLNSNGSSNPILAVVMEAARNGDAFTSVLFVIALGVLPALCEETLFRGFLYTSLRTKLSAFLSMIISAAVFAGIHLDQGAFIQLFVLGFVFAFVFERTRSLIPSMVAHCMWNSGTFFVISAIFGS